MLYSVPRTVHNGCIGHKHINKIGHRLFVLNSENEYALIDLLTFPHKNALTDLPTKLRIFR